MRQLYRFGAGGVAVLVTLIATVVGGALPASSDYYGAVYPQIDPGGGDKGGDGNARSGGNARGGGGNNRGGSNGGGAGGNNAPPNDLENSVEKAALRWSFRPAKVTQYVPARFTATIIYDREVSGRTIFVAYENVASLRATKKGEFDIVRRTGASQRLDEGHRLPGGGYELSWHWDVTPESAGKKNLELEIQPVIVINGSRRKGIQVRNEPVRIAVSVHPNAVALKKVYSRARNMHVALPTELVAGQPVEVTATFPLRPYEKTVEANVTLARAPDSIHVSIFKRQQTISAGSLVAKFSVTPSEEGTLDLLFRTELSTRAGEQSLHKRVEIARSNVVSKPFWSQFVNVFTGIGAIVAALAGIIGLTALFRKKRSSTAPTDG